MERDLRDELAGSVSKSVSDADRARIAELHKAEAELRIEVSKYVGCAPATGVDFSGVGGHIICSYR